MNKKKKKNVSDVIKSVICTKCHTCLGICPTGAIEKDKNGIIFINEKKCIQCGLCRQVCPAINENFKTLNKEIFKKLPGNMLIGNYSGCYIGCSKNEKIRYNAASGGIITTLLLFLLKNGLIDGALLTRPKKDDPIAAEPFIARNEKEILSALGARYVPVPLNMMLKQIRGNKGRFAVVGLPCHMQGIRRAEMASQDLKEKIAYHLGIICAHNINAEGVEYILKRKGIKPDNIEKMDYRGKGWPSGLTIYQKDGKVRKISNQGSLWSEIFGGFYFGNYYCTVCQDHLNEYSDISFADAWLPGPMQNDKKGSSILICRTPEGEKLLSQAKQQDYLKLTPILADTVIESQMMMSCYKKRNIEARWRLLSLFGRPLPKKNRINIKNLPKARLTDYLTAPFPYLNHMISKHAGFLDRIPDKFLKKERKAYKKLLLNKSGEMLDSIMAVDKRTKRILIINSHSSNRGDESAQRSMIRSIKKRAPYSSFTVVTFSPDSMDLPDYVKKMKSFQAAGLKKSIILCYAFFLKHGIKLPFLGELGPMAVVEEMLHADLVISAPGGPYIGDYYIDHEKEEHLFQLELAELFKKPIMIYAPSMGPFKNKKRNRIRKRILEKIDIITVRDKYSLDYLKTLNIINPEIHLTLDSAFQDKPDLPENEIQKIMTEENIITEHPEDGKEMLVGFVPAGAKWNYRRGTDDPKKKEEKYVGMMARVLDRLHKKYGARIVFFPQLYGATSDIAIIDRIIAKMNNKSCVVVLSGKWNSDVQQALIARMGFFISNRYHPAIFAIKAAVPVICIAYEHKAEGMMKAFDNKDYLIRIEDLNEDLLEEKFDLMVANDNVIRRKLREILEEKIKAASVNSDLVFGMLRNL